MSCRTLKEIEAYKIALKQSKRVLKLKYFKNAKINFHQLAKYLLAIAEVESNLNTCADNKNSTAYGLTQILNGSRQDYEKLFALPKTSSQKALASADYAMFLGAGILAYQQKRYNNWNKAIIAYNQGNAESAAMQRGKGYLAKVSNAYRGNDFALLDSQAGSDLALNELPFYQEFP